MLKKEKKKKNREFGCVGRIVGKYMGMGKMGKGNIVERGAWSVDVVEDLLGNQWLV